MALRNLVYMLPNSDVKAKVILMELSAGGFGFIPNLVAVDASLILPVSLGIINLAIIEVFCPLGFTIVYLINVNYFSYKVYQSRMNLQNFRKEFHTSSEGSVY